jgi:hypothetical protein
MGVEKIILGIILVIIGLLLILPVTWCQGISLPCFSLWQDLWLVLKGIVPAFLIFIGAILVWIESEELKIERPKRRR